MNKQIMGYGLGMIGVYLIGFGLNLNLWVIYGMILIWIGLDSMISND